MNIDFIKEISEIAKQSNFKKIEEEKTAPKLNKITNERQQEKERIKTIYTYYQDNIKESEALRMEINKAIADGKDLQTITLKCIECIGKMTGDQSFINSNIERLKLR